MRNTSKLLIDEPPLQVLPTLAKSIGLNQAIFIQQLHFRLRISLHVVNGRRWYYATLDEWQQMFPFWTVRTIRRIIDDLEHTKKLILTGVFNKMAVDRTKWYTVDYDALDEVLPKTADEVDNLSTWEAASGDGQDAGASGQNGQLPSGQDGQMPSGQGGHVTGGQIGLMLPNNRSTVPNTIPAAASAAGAKGRHLSPACKAYKTIIGYYPNRIQEAEIDKTISDLPKWEAVLKTWMLSGQAKKNDVLKQLDWYTKGVPSQVKEVYRKASLQPAAPGQPVKPTEKPTGQFLPSRKGA